MRVQDRGSDAGRRCGKRLTPPSDVDWRRSLAAIARYLPGLGDPMALTLPDYEEWMAALAYVLERENGGGEDGHRRIVEDEMRRLHH